MFEITTALKKIRKLTKPIRVIQGGTYAGKTYCIVPILIDRAIKEPNKKITVIAETVPAVKEGAEDIFKTFMLEVGYWQDKQWNGQDHIYRFQSGSRIQFKSYDTPGKAKQAGKRDILFINEANHIKWEIAEKLISRSAETYLDFNPDGEFWAHTEILTQPNSESLTLTYLDNERLPEHAKQDLSIKLNKAFFDSKAKNLFDKENIKSEYWSHWWKVYGLGQIAERPNRILHFEMCESSDFDNFEGAEMYGIDWGVVDPFGVVHAKYRDGELYLKELNYLSETELRIKYSEDMSAESMDNGEGIVIRRMKEMRIPKNKIIVCDSNRPGKILALRKHGWEYAVSIGGKPKITDGISLLNDLKVYYTRESKNIETEQKKYSWRTDRYGIVLEEPEDAYNHLIDPVRYILDMMRRKGIVRI